MLNLPENPILTIIVPNYNSNEHLPTLLDSVQAQSLRDIEVIIVDDGSTVSCQNIVESYRNKGLSIRLIQHEQRRGTYQARITGVREATAHTIAFADADDILYGTKALEHHIHMLLTKNADIMHFNTIRNDIDTGEQQLSTWDAPFAATLHGEQIFRAFVQADLRAHAVWNKLYSRELCLKSLTFYSCDTILHAQEDFLFSVCLFANSTKYNGSEHIGYVYNYKMDMEKIYQRASGNLIAEHIMLNILPLHAYPQNVLEHYKKNMLTQMLLQAARLCKKAYNHNGMHLMKARFAQLVVNEEKALLQEALNFVLNETLKQDHPKHLIRQLAGCIDELKKQNN